MARIHAHTRGKSHSTRPASPSSPSWVKMTSAEVSSLVISLSKEGLSPSEIGLDSRDYHAIPLVKPITGKTITQMLSEGDVKRAARGLGASCAKGSWTPKTSKKSQHRPQEYSFIGINRSKY